MQVPTLEQHLDLVRKYDELLARITKLEAAQPEWLREEEAQRLTGLSQPTLARERKKPDTLLVFKTAGGLRYLRSSVEAFNEARMLRKGHASPLTLTSISGH
ncbi:hypothetical protein FNT36_14430 [Hymenobacter setariae]|uniref:DNA-binding protein n=1 Tax=Hymenobacter setariae TaxID=2594794 RepID=A0A558BVZ9_9BACT|nr:hypothetical protein [Hymenobacter setariae]TVT40661.1 hypothetical protein FNT36_14430 [Hymenobacter setariae]